jgi:hypothetical protein
VPDAQAEVDLWALRADLRERMIRESESGGEPLRKHFHPSLRPVAHGGGSPGVGRGARTSSRLRVGVPAGHSGLGVSGLAAAGAWRAEVPSAWRVPVPGQPFHLP